MDKEARNEKGNEMMKPKIRSERPSKKTPVNVMIEIPKASRNKYEFDRQRKLLKFDRMLFSA